MPISEPSWWYGPGSGWQTTLLSPIGTLVGRIASRRIQNANPYRSAVPVICVGNFTAGGSGKTPLALFLARLVAEEDREPWFLSRGYGGSLEGPARVIADLHTARDVGDEPLLLARAAPTVVSRDRRKGAEAIERMASKRAVIIMDDGLQNPALAKDLAIALVDAKRGVGNGLVIPAGPLRAPLHVQTALANLIVLTGGDDADRAGSVAGQLKALSRAPIISAQTRAEDDNAKFRGRRVYAFAGIANPGRFFATLSSLGADIIARRAFADHHMFSEAEARELMEAAERSNALLVTTEKDIARLSGIVGARGALKERAETVSIRTSLEGGDLDVLRRLIREAIAR
ncbi:tetraacyldisaccharide 4'-kinase [Hyphomicrobium facile]|uniref:Tetraacyldisaccharide 4'-kinase n=1 Tax=Hyphomicrobium facile TaxID=51670 RepID=A0A1I7NLK8_9HYPH|nr:tetraacyldisaccharide 4'-kinase [Hyphomicrobium facile]SFV35518.1 lipid-A-disaccharide kinase [Hyphomicrobium facile]